MSFSKCVISTGISQEDAAEMRLALGAGDPVMGLERYVEDVDADLADLRQQLSDQNVDAVLKPRVRGGVSPTDIDAGGEVRYVSFRDERLTNEQNKMVDLAQNGFSHAEIAEQLQITPETARAGLQKIKKTYGIEVEKARKGKPPTEQAAIYKLSEQGLDAQQIAERLGKDVNTVQTAISQVQSAMREGKPLFQSEIDPAQARRDFMDHEVVSEPIPGEDARATRYGFINPVTKQVAAIELIPDSGYNAFELSFSDLGQDGFGAARSDNIGADEIGAIVERIQAVVEAQGDKAVYVEVTSKAQQKLFKHVFSAIIGDTKKVVADENRVYITDKRDNFYHGEIKGPGAVQNIKRTGEKKPGARRAFAQRVRAYGGARRRRDAARSRDRSLPGQNLEQGQRGAYDPVTGAIYIFEQRDLSTLMHEAAHWWLDAMLKLEASGKAPPSVSKQLDAIFEWHGLDRSTPIYDQAGNVTAKGRELHEAFSETFEVYLQKGKAPSAKLRGAFRAFKQWLVNIYRTLDPRTRANLTPEITGVFDRMLATSQEIESASRPIQADAEAMATTLLEREIITQRQYDRVGPRLQDAREKAKEDLLARLMDDVARQEKAWWKTERERLRKDIARAFDRSPIGQAISRLGEGERTAAARNRGRAERADAERRARREWIEDAVTISEVEGAGPGARLYRFDLYEGAPIALNVSPDGPGKAVVDWTLPEQVVQADPAVLGPRLIAILEYDIETAGRGAYVFKSETDAQKQTHRAILRDGVLNFDYLEDHHVQALVQENADLDGQ